MCISHIKSEEIYLWGSELVIKVEICIAEIPTPPEVDGIFAYEM
jgi:hypothetical protein